MTFNKICALEGDDWILANDMINKEDQEETGYIGCMTMYYRKQEDKFVEGWCQGFGPAQPPEFFEELRETINCLRQSARYSILWEPGEPVWSQEYYRRGFKGRRHPDFSARVDAGQHTYLFLCDPWPTRSRDVHIACYHTETMETFLKRWDEKRRKRKEETAMAAGGKKAPVKIQSATAARKRERSISWDEYFMGVASLSAMRSKDPSTQVGCCIVGAKNRIASVGYNGFPFGCGDDEYPWSRRTDGLEESETKYPYVVHSELNAILNYRGESLDGARMYVTMFPCCECAKAIIQAGIREVVYRDDAYLHSQSGIAATRMFKSAGVSVRRMDTGKEATIHI